MIPEGIYAAAVVPVETPHGSLSIQFGPPTPNSPFSAALSFEIINGPCSGQRMTAFLYFGDKAGKSGKTTFERSIESLRICGFTGDDLDKFSDQHPDQEVSLTVKHEVYTNPQTGEKKTTAKVAWINSPMRGFVIEAPLATSDLRKFSAQFKGALKRMPPVVTRKAERQAPSAAPPADDGGGWSGNDQLPPPDDNGPVPGLAGTDMDISF
jgi:hypothetical protein